VTDCVGNRKRLDVGPAFGQFYGFGGNISEREANDVSGELAKRLQARWDNFGKLPVRFRDWYDDRPAYGSWAYELYGARDDIMWEREHEYLNR